MPFKNLLSKLTPLEEGGRKKTPGKPLDRQDQDKLYTARNRPETSHKQDMHLRTNYSKEASSEPARIARQSKLRDLNIQRNMKKAELDQVLRRLHDTKNHTRTQKDRKDLYQAHNRLNLELHHLTDRINKVLQIDQEIDAQYPRRKPREEIEQQFDPPRQPRYHSTDPSHVHHHHASSANQPWHHANPLISPQPISRPNASPPGHRPRHQQRPPFPTHLVPSAHPSNLSSSSSSNSKLHPTPRPHPARVSPDISPVESHFAFKSDDGEYCVSPIEQQGGSPSWELGERSRRQ